jgi:hypothetical protein
MYRKLIVTASLLITGCASNPQMVGVECPPLPSVPKELMEPPQNVPLVTRSLNEKQP